MPRDWRRNAFGSLRVEHVEHEVGVGDVVDQLEAVASNASPTARTQASCSGEVDVPQIAYFRMRALYRGDPASFLGRAARARGSPVGSRMRRPLSMRRAYRPRCGFPQRPSLIAHPACDSACGRTGTEPPHVPLDRNRCLTPILASRTGALSGRDRARAASRGRPRCPSPRASTPRTIAAGICRALPSTSSAAPAISSATAISVELELVAARVVRAAEIAERRDARDARARHRSCPAARHVRTSR